jgi:hypothetical protein
MTDLTNATDLAISILAKEMQKKHNLDDSAENALLLVAFVLSREFGFGNEDRAFTIDSIDMDDFNVSHAKSIEHESLSFGLIELCKSEFLINKDEESYTINKNYKGVDSDFFNKILSEIQNNAFDFYDYSGDMVIHKFSQQLLEMATEKRG